MKTAVKLAWRFFLKWLYADLDDLSLHEPYNHLREFNKLWDAENK